MNSVNVIMSLAAGVVLVKTICLAAQVNARDWPGHPLRFAGLAAAHAFMAAGATGVALGWPNGAVLLMVGVAVKAISERRRGDA